MSFLKKIKKFFDINEEPTFPPLQRPAILFSETDPTQSDWENTKDFPWWYNAIGKTMWKNNGKMWVKE